ncbi:enoyl-CoA hydratase/carnithine racemase [Tumebacillus sp. BK434]|uniref:enoyl-CoA hydratase/isomerase family protein n=1 Tax=Tumebacillus sp. BK434 TaxID=2512169 RepID=UPI0010503AC5|nr:enoyl-CoA hydratase-related protein [Tumebacillus sp. BK434]TCP54668.1 enoyl-CoA hydratase/carnithine racemase [Tumebacillus sp. BK434]
MSVRAFTRLTKENGIAILTIDNPPLNVLSERVGLEIRECVTEVEHDEEVVVLIVTGAGRAFIAGADIKEFPSKMARGEAKKMALEHFHTYNRLDFLPKPTIAALNGVTLGGGLELAMACDIRIAGESVKLGLPEIKLGLFPGAGGTQRLPRLVGEGRAKELMFIGDPITAQEAWQIGLVNKVVPDDKVLTSALDMANVLATRTLTALSRIKKAVDKGLEMDLTSGVLYEAELLDEVFQTEDIVEGCNAFLEKREPKFKHR